ncbi:unnamed protein product [Litomosoides sigmodontis]|uniref:Uncharacterized protein n=1 Tax=Litomosoides sigmodontis TaxID=42156 RepID=A0A3P6TMK1_LITSI|nr:unnamed protein product [Litomosoides sigmodontis]
MIEERDKKMKVFTIGMDEKPPIKDNAVSPDGVTLTSAPIISLEKKRTSYKNYVMCFGTLFFILSFTIIISKLVYYRIPDDLGLPWFELRRRMGVGCDDCVSARIIQSFYPQRPARVFESGNSAAPLPALALQAGQQPQTSGQSASTVSQPQRFESEASIDLPQAIDSRLDFLRKIIPKIKEQAEKSGIEGVMQVKVLRMDSFEPRQLLDGSDENQLQPGIGTVQSPDFMAPLRPTLLSDLLRWNTIDNDERSQQDDIAKSGPMLIMGSFLPPQQMQLLPGAWSGSLQPRLLDLAQQVSRQQQWNNLWQWPLSIHNKNGNEKATQWQSQWQWSNNPLLTPAMQQSPLPLWESGNQWPESTQVGSNWQSSAQNGANANRLQQSEWQGHGQQQQLWSQYPQIWQESLNQNSNNWNIQKANIVDNLDGRMTQAVLPNDNFNNNYVYNNNANDQWNRYYLQWHANNQRLQQQQPIANAVVSQSLEVAGPVLSQQIPDQSLGQRQSQIDSLQSQTALEQQPIESLPPLTQQQKQQSESKPIQSQIDRIPNELFHQNPSVPVVPNDNAPRTLTPFVFSSDEWKKFENPSLLAKPTNDDQDHLQPLHQQRRQLPIHPIENMLSDSSGNTKMIDSELNKDPVMEQSGPVNNISRRLSSSVLFQIDEPPPQPASMEENFAK